jgi:hypothetical protein
LTPLVLLSGMAMSPQLNVAFHWLPAVFGGRQSARSVHFILAFGFVFFVFGHVFMVLTQGFFNNMRSMTTGWYKEKVPISPALIKPAPIKPATTPRPDITKALNTPEHPKSQIEISLNEDSRVTPISAPPLLPDEKAQSDAPSDETTEEKKHD